MEGVEGMSREVIAGIAGGIVGAGLARLTAPEQQKVTSSKELIDRYVVEPGQSYTLKSTTNYKFAIILFHGDGDAEITIEILRGGTFTSLYGNQQAIELIANEAIRIEAFNTDKSSSRQTPTIEILSLSW
jgi:hypothetical protein